MAFTRQSAVEYGPSNIRVNSISPGTIITPMAEANTDLSWTTSHTPLHRCGRPVDVAETVVFLATDKSKHITGQNIVIDGGITITGSWASID